MPAGAPATAWWRMSSRVFGDGLRELAGKGDDPTGHSLDVKVGRGDAERCDGVAIDEDRRGDRAYAAGGHDQHGSGDQPERRDCRDQRAPHRSPPRVSLDAGGRDDRYRHPRRRRRERSPRAQRQRPGRGDQRGHRRQSRHQRQSRVLVDVGGRDRGPRPRRSRRELGRGRQRGRAGGRHKGGPGGASPGRRPVG